MAERVTAATGYEYMRVDTTDTAAIDGAVLMNRHGELEGMLMPPSWLLRNEVGNPGEVYAVDAPEIAGTVLPVLRSGDMRIEPVPWERPIGHPDQYWYGILDGHITIDGADAPIGARLHMRVRKEGLPDYWETEQIHELGFFLFSVDPGRHGYQEATIELWMDCRRSPVTAVLEPFSGLVQRLDLAF